jgi:hypothetical protein
MADGYSADFNLPPASRACKTPVPKQGHGNQRKALDWLGVGAKTAVGYGRMRETPLDLFRSAWVDRTIQEIRERNRWENPPGKARATKQIYLS